MQKVHGPAVETPLAARHLDQPSWNALVVGLALLLIVYAAIYFGLPATS